MTKVTKTTVNEGFAYNVGKDIANLENEVELLKALKKGEALKIIIPAKPEGLGKYDAPDVDVKLPDEFKNSIAVKLEYEGNPKLLFLKDGYTTYAADAEREITLVRLGQISSDVISVQGTLNVESVNKLKRIERERKLPMLTYLYLAKWLTENHLTEARKVNTNIYVNKNGLDDLLTNPFQKAGSYAQANNVGVDVEPIKAELQELKKRIDAGEINPENAEDFVIPTYNIYYASQL